LCATLAAALTADGWIGTESNNPPSGVTAEAFSHPTRRIDLLITSGPDEPPCANLTGRTVDSLARWSVEITAPTTGQILAAARVAAGPDSLTTFDLASALDEAGWSASGHGRLGKNRVSSTTRKDGNRTVFHYAAVYTKNSHEPGGWVFRGDGMTADATDDTPHAIILGLALS
jgi:hypothetical protein